MSLIYFRTQSLVQSFNDSLLKWNSSPLRLCVTVDEREEIRIRFERGKHLLDQIPKPYYTWFDDGQFMLHMTMLLSLLDNLEDVYKRV